MEIWRDIPSFEGYYQASNLGRIRSLDRMVPGKNGSYRFVKGTVLKPGLTSYEPGRGYYRVRLSNKWFLVSVLVWITFRGPIPEGMQVNHINEQKLDNRIENLNLLTASENNRWGTRIERFKKAITNGNCSKKILQYDLDGNFIREWPSQGEIERQTGIKQQSVSKVCSGKRKQTGGFIWSYFRR